MNAVTMEREFAGPARLTDVARAAFGPRCRLDGVERLRGGSQKGVYRLTVEDGGGLNR